MTYTELHKIIKGLREADFEARLKIEVAEAVYDDIDLSAYDEEGVNELCDRVKAYWLSHDCVADLDDFAFCIQDLINDENYETPTEDCLANAWEMALDIMQGRIG